MLGLPRRTHDGSILSSLLGILIVPAHVSAAAIVASSQASQEVIIENVTASDSSVGGTVVNNSSKTFRNVVLLIRQDWLWNDERNPGPDSPGRTLSFILRQDIAPHASASFALQTPPLAERPDGRFVTTVEVTDFSEVGF
jgi:hypothetical protein